MRCRSSETNQGFGAVEAERCACSLPAATWRGGKLRAAEYVLAVEEPLEIFVNGRLLETVMRSPGDDVNLAMGLCFTGGVISDVSEVESARLMETGPGPARVLVELRSGEAGRSERQSKSAAEDQELEPAGLRGQPGHVLGGGEGASGGAMPSWGQQVIRAREALEAGQTLFSLTGCTHACSVFDRDGSMLSLAEDVGRHNALDKAAGYLVCGGRLRESHLLLMSSRLSKLIVAKASRLGIAILAGMSAPTAGAVETALGFNLTLVGFVRNESFTVYTQRSS